MSHVSVFAHISDLHLDGGARSSRRAEKVRDHLLRLPRPVDAVIVSGDIADHGTVEEYGNARKLLAELPFPVITCPGNHDIRAEFRTVLLDDPAGHDRPINQVLDVAGVRLALCDSTIPGRPDGHLANETLSWLKSSISETSTPVILGMHHPPVELGIPYVDGIRQLDASRLEDLVRRHTQVVAVIVGHAHTGASTMFGGRPLLVAPGVVNTAMLPWEKVGNPPLDLDQPPQLAFHVYDNQTRRLTTHYRTVH